MLRLLRARRKPLRLERAAVDAGQRDVLGEQQRKGREEREDEGEPKGARARGDRGIGLLGLAGGGHGGVLPQMQSGA